MPLMVLPGQPGAVHWTDRPVIDDPDFDSKRIHFVCLCTEDPVLGIGDAQLAFLRRDLAAHANAWHTPRRV